MTKPSTEAKRRKVAATAIDRLLSGDWHRRGELFGSRETKGNRGSWQYDLLKRLLGWNIIERTEGTSVWKTRYRLTTNPDHARNARAVLAGALQSDDILTELLWPGTGIGDSIFADGAPPVEEFDETAGLDNAPDNLFAGLVPKPDEPPPVEEEEAEEVTPEQVMEALLKLMAAVIEKLDRVEKTTNETLKILKQLL